MNRTANNTVDMSFSEVEKHIKSSDYEEILQTMKNNYAEFAKNSHQGVADFIVLMFNTFDFWGFFNPEKNDFQMMELRAKCLKEHIDDISDMYFSLSDYTSRISFLGLILYWYNFDLDAFNRMQERKFDTYFDLDLIYCDGNEVFVDAGTYNGDTILKYISNYGIGNYKRIIGYEINPEVFEQAKANLSGHNRIDIRLKGVADRNGLMRVNEKGDTILFDAEGEGRTVPVIKIDDDIEEKITFLKTDLEGADFAAIKGAEKHIINDRPKMAVSIYHSNDDLWRIFKYLKNICPDYDFFFRFYGLTPEKPNLWPIPIDYMLVCVPR